MASLDNTSSQPIENRHAPEDVTRATSLSQEANSLHSSTTGSRGADAASLSGAGGSDASGKGQMDAIHKGFDNTAGLYNLGGSAGDKGSAPYGAGHAGAHGDGASDAGSYGAGASSMDSLPSGVGAHDAGSAGGKGGAPDAGYAGTHPVGAHGGGASDAGSYTAGPSSMDSQPPGVDAYDTQGATGGYSSASSAVDGMGGSPGSYKGGDALTYSAESTGAQAGAPPGASFDSSTYSGTSDGRMPQAVTMEHIAGAGSDSGSGGGVPQAVTMEHIAGMGSDGQITDFHYASTSSGADSSYKPYDLSTPSGNSSLPPLEITDRGAGDGASGDGKNGGDKGGQPSPYADRAQEILDKARAVEPDVTKDIQCLAGDTGGEPAGLDHRLKTQDSLARKLETEKTSDVNDALRYTIAYPSDNLAAGANKTMEQLEQKGYTKCAVKNTFEQENAPYKGINTTFSKGDQKFEVQFHTPQSFDVKTNTHPLYDIKRDLPAHNDGKAETGDLAAAKAKQYIGHVKNEPQIDKVVTELATSKGLDAAKTASRLHKILTARSAEMNAAIPTPRDIHTVKNFPPKRNGGEGQF